MRKHSSFLLRCWELGNDEQRIEIEHIQSGTKVLARSVADAVEWICEQGDASTQHGQAPGQAGAEISNQHKGGRSGSFERQ